VLRRPIIAHDDRLELVDHLGELRGRIIASASAFGVALALCMWQNHLVLRAANLPLHGHRLVTFGVAEPFTTTLRIAAYAAIVLALPVVLYQVYAFLLPAFSPRERRAALPLMLLVPVLFVAGAAFGFFLVVPAALSFLLHFNADQFHVQLRAGEYYGFLTTTLVACGIVFQVPVGVLAVTRLGIVSPAKLRSWRRYAYLACAVAAAALPGVDPVSMLIEMVPLVALYELSLVLASALGSPREAVTEDQSSAAAA
jgi:sec-independent protein translocase protein TatC